MHTKPTFSNTHAPLTGGIAMALIGIVDCLNCGTGLVGTCLVSLRALGLGIGFGFAQFLLAKYCHKRFWASTVAVILGAAWAWAIGVHLASTATLMALMPAKITIAATVLLATPVIALVLIFHTKRFIYSNTTPYNYLAVPAAIGLFWIATTIRDLHMPLALTAALMAWLLLELTIGTMAPRLKSMGKVAVGIFVLCVFTCFIRVSIEDYYNTMERGVITGFTAKLGAVLTIADLSEELIDQNLVFDNDKNSPKEFFDAPFFPGRSIVMISVDALRPDHLGSSGYDRPVSKNIDALAAKSVVFERAYSCAPVSSMSIPSIQTGVRMENILKLGTKLPSTLAGRLKKAGYKTIGLFPKKVFSVGPALMAEIERTGFEFEKVIELEREAQKDAAEVKKAVLSEQGRPLFLWVHFYEPHLPYHCHDKPFGSEPIDCYDAEIQHLDDTLGELIPWLDQQLDDPILVFTADHGEAFGEHGRFYHSTDLHEEQIRVPLFFRLPQVDPRSVRAPVSNVSIAPTLEALVLENPSNSGSDLRGLMLKEKETTPVLAAVEDKRTVIDGHQKLICNGWPDGPCAYYLLDTDPNEKNNLAGKRPKEAAMLLARLKNKERSELTKVSGGLPRPIVLGRLERADAVDGLLELAEKKGPYAVEAAMLLAMMQRYEFRRTLSKLHDSDNDQVAAWSCIGSTLLEKSCPKEAVLKFLNEKTKLGKWSAVALGNMKYEIALNPLLSNLESKDPQLRARSAQALGELGTPKAVPALIKLAKKVPQTRWAAIDALGLIGDSRACPVLLEIIKTDPDQHNKKKCTRALEKIND